MCVHIGLAVFLLLIVVLLTLLRCFLPRSPHGDLMGELLDSLESQPANAALCSLPLHETFLFPVRVIRSLFCCKA